MTQNATHTPGPWEWQAAVGDEGEFDLVRKGFSVGDYDSILHHGADWDMTEADRRLIAAAPEMFSELDAMVAALEDGETVVIEPGSVKAERIRAAIAKALSH